MNTLILPTAFLFDDSLRIIPKYALDNSKDVLCRPVGPVNKRRYMAIVTRRNFPRGFDGQRIEQPRVRLMAEEYVEVMKVPSVESVLTAYGQDVFGETPVFSFSNMTTGMDCEVCKQAKGPFASPAILLSCTNVWGTIYVLAVCEDHYKKNHGMLKDDIEV